MKHNIFTGNQGPSTLESSLQKKIARGCDRLRDTLQRREHLQRGDTGVDDPTEY